MRVDIIPEERNIVPPFCLLRNDAQTLSRGQFFEDNHFSRRYDASYYT